MASTRTNKRSRSGAHEPCPHCGKQLRGRKGLAMHIRDEHLTNPTLGGTSPNAEEAAQP